VYRVFIARDLIEAHFVRDLLERAGIATKIGGESLFGLRPEIGIDTDTLPSVWIVNDAQVDEALEIVAEQENR
jgi:Putative prokaryotic signal transducing protein